MKLTKQDCKIHDYVLARRGATRDMQRDLGIECPSPRVTGLRNKGVVVQSIGEKK